MTITATPPQTDWAPPRQPVATQGAQPAKNRAFKVLALLAVLAFAAAAFIVASLAVFSDSETVDNNDFTTGTIDLTTNPTTAAFTVAPMAPGDIEFSTITVGNNGTLDLRYSLRSETASGSQPLADALVLAVSVVPAGVDCNNTDWNTVGTEIVGSSGVLSLATPGRQVFGTASTTDGTGDRTVAVSGSEILCVRVELPLATSDPTLEGATVEADFIFEAEQTANN